MACITKEQQGRLFQSIGRYISAQTDLSKYSHIEHMKDMYNKFIAGGKFPATALSYIQLMPRYIQQYLLMSNNNNLVSDDVLMQLSVLPKKFESGKLEDIANFLGFAQPEEKDEVYAPQVIKLNAPLFGALPASAWSTLLSEAVKGEQRRDPEMNWHHEFNRLLIPEISGLNASNAFLNGHTGFKLKAVKMSSIPYAEVYSKFKSDEYSEDNTLKFFDKNQMVALVVTDNKGNELRFNEKYEVDPNGKLVYFQLRDTNYENLNDPEARGRIQSVQEIAKKTRQTPEEVEKIIKEQLEVLRDIQKTVFKNNDVLLDITSGSLGYTPVADVKSNQGLSYDNAPTTLREVVGNKPIDIYIETEGGKPQRYFILNGNKEILLKPNITEAQAMQLAEAAFDLVNSAEESKKENTATVATQFVSQYVGMSHQTQDALTNKLLSDATVESIAEFIAKPSPNSKFTRFLDFKSASESQYFKLENGKVVPTTFSDYMNYWKDVYKTRMIKNDDGKVELFNSYLNFEVTPEGNKTINDTLKKTTEVKPLPSKKPSALQSNDDFYKELNITSEATKQQIKEAKEWWDNNPISKAVPFKEMFKVVNKTSKAKFGKNGITLFFGSNYTDTYHEAWHAFSQLFMTIEEKTKLYESLKKRSDTFVLPNGTRIAYADATFRQLEENLAEGFRKYKLSRNKKVLDKYPEASKLFKLLVKVLEWLFDGVSFNQAAINSNTIKNVKELYDKLDIGKFETGPSESNKMFMSLAKPIGSSGETEGLNMLESEEVASSIDSIISDILHDVSKTNKNIIYKIFTTKNGIKNMYMQAKGVLENKLEELQEDVEANEDAIRILSIVIDNFGDIEDVVDNNIDNDSTVAYHLKSSKILDFSEKDNEIDKELADSGELSFDELANQRVLFLIKTLKSYTTKKGVAVPEKNSLGFDKLTNYRKTLGNLINLLNGNTGPINIYSRLQANADRPEIKELLEKLGNIDPNQSIENEDKLRSWMLFANSFNTTSLPLIITKLEQDSAEDTINIYNVDASSDLSSVKYKIANEFKVKTFNNPVGTLTNDGVVLDMVKLENLFPDIADGSYLDKRYSMSDKFERAMEFFKAIGFPVDTFEYAKILPADFSKNAKYVYNTLADARKQYIPDHFTYLTTGGEKSEGSASQQSVVDNLVRAHIKVNDIISSFSLMNAERNRQYSNVLNNQMTIVQNNLNNASSFEEFYNTPGFEHFNPNRNPAVKQSKLLKKIFGENLGKKVDNLVLKNFSGMQLVKDGEFQNGISNNNTDFVSKFYLDLYSYINEGYTEVTRHADKTLALTFYAENNPEYINKESFFTSIGYSGFVSTMMGYLKAEYERIYDITNNNVPDLNNFKVFKKFGDKFLIFDDIISNETKAKIKKLTSEEFNNLAPDSELYVEISDQITDYLDRLTQDNLKMYGQLNFFDTRAISRVTKTFRKASEKDKIEALIKAFTANTFIQHVESTIMFYGDMSAYDHLKEDFHKRNASAGSTGRTFISDKIFLEGLNSIYGYKYAESLSKSYGVDPNTGTINTAVLGDVSYEDPEIIKEYRESWEKRYTQDFAKLGLKGEELDKKVKEAVNKATVKYLESEVKEGDGQGWITFDAYRIFALASNEWSDEQEKLYKKIVNKESVELDTILKVFPPRKYQYYGPIKTSKYYVNALHKFSLLPLIPNVIQGKNLDMLHKRMIDNNVHYATFQSGSKLAVKGDDSGNVDKFYSDSKLRIMSTEPLTLNQINLKFLRNQVPINSYFKEEVVFSTQMRAMILNELYEKGIPLNSKVGGLATKYLESIERYIDHNKAELEKEIEYNKESNTFNQAKLAKLIETELDRRDVPEHLRIVATSLTNGKFTYDLSLARNAQDIENLLFSIVNKRIVRKKTNGEPLVLAASSGFETQRATNPTEEDLKKYEADKLKFYRFDPITGKYLPMEVKIALQGDFKKLLDLKHPDKKLINTRERLNEALKDKDWTEQHKDFLIITGVRIPVQGFNSMEMMQVVEFLPETAGPIIVPPSYIVSKAGSDFDIDKLSIFFPNISSKVSYNLSNKNLKSIVNNPRLAQAFTGYKLSKEDVVKFIVDVLNNKEKKYTLTENDKLIVEALNEVKEADVKIDDKGGKGLENDILKNIVNILSSEEIFTSLVRANDTDMVEPLAQDMKKYFTKEYNPLNNYGNSDPFFSTPQEGVKKSLVSPTRIFETQYNIYKQIYNVVGKKSLGIAAVDNKFNSYLNQVGMYMNDSYMHVRTDKKGKVHTQERLIRILLDHNAQDGKISLSELYNKDAEKIGDLINQLMNGFVDVAKDPWVAYVMGTPEATPALLYLIQAGVPFKTAVYFLAQPVVREYLDNVKKLESPTKVLDKTFKDPFEFSIKARMMNLQAKGNGQDLWNVMMQSIKAAEQFYPDNSLFTQDNLLAKLDKSLTNEYGMTDMITDKAILAHFFEINDAATALFKVKNSLNFDTKTSSDLYDAFKRVKKKNQLLTDEEEDINYINMFPKDKLKALYSDTIVHNFDVSDMQMKLFSPLFPIRNNGLLNEYLSNLYTNDLYFGSRLSQTIKSIFGTDEKFIAEFKNDFTTAMVLNSLRDFNLSTGEYRGLKLVNVNKVKYQPTKQGSVRQVGPETKINIYAGTGENAELSNFAIRPFTHLGIKFDSVEQAFQFYKTEFSPKTENNKAVGSVIKDTTNGKRLKELGREFKGLDRKVWDNMNSTIMKALLKDSFEQNPDALAKLFATGNSTLTHVGTEKPNKWTTEFPRLLMEVRNELKSTQQQAPTTTSNNPAEYTNHSGGAYGADTFWDQIGREFGVTKHMHYRESANSNLSQKLRDNKVEAKIISKQEMDKARAEVKRILGEEYPDTLEGNLKVRNFYQVINSDAVFAVGQLADANGKAIKSYSYFNIKGVTGGTNVAVQLGIKLNKPVYVWDLGLKTWFMWNGQHFTATETPTLTKNFAGVGTRDIELYNVQNKETKKWEPRKQYVGKELEEAAKQAIRDVYQNTFGNQKESSIKPTIINENVEDTSKIPVPKYIASGAYVQNGEMLVDMDTIRDQYQALMSGSPNKFVIQTVSEQLEPGKPPVQEQIIMETPDAKAFKVGGINEYLNFVLEREYLRSILSEKDLVAIKKIADKEIKQNVAKSKYMVKIGNPMDLTDIMKESGKAVMNENGLFDIIDQKEIVDEETGEITYRTIVKDVKKVRNNIYQQFKTVSFSKQIAQMAAIENYLTDSALKNILNTYQFTENTKNNYPLQIQDIINNYPELKRDYLLANELMVKKPKGSKIYSLSLRSNDMDPAYKVQLNQDLIDLCNPKKEKVSDPEVNNYISEAFSKMIFYSLLTEGYSKIGEQGLSNILDQDVILEIGSNNNLQEKVNRLLSTEISPNGKPKYVNELNAFTNTFLKNRLGLEKDETGRYKVSPTSRTEAKNYVAANAVENRASDKPAQNRYGLVKRNDSLYIINVNAIKQYAKEKNLKNLLSSELQEITSQNPDVTFIFSPSDKIMFKAPNVITVANPEALNQLDIAGPIVLSTEGLRKVARSTADENGNTVEELNLPVTEEFSKVLLLKFGVTNTAKIKKTAKLMDVLNSNSMITTVDMIKNIRAKSHSILNELNNSCNI